MKWYEKDIKEEQRGNEDEERKAPKEEIFRLREVKVSQDLDKVGSDEGSDRQIAKFRRHTGSGQLWPHRTSESMGLWSSPTPTAISANSHNSNSRQNPNSPPPTPNGSQLAFSPVTSISESQMSGGVGEDEASHPAAPASSSSTSSSSAAAITTASTSAASSSTQGPWSSTVLERLGVPEAVLRELSCAYLNAIAANLNANLNAMGAHFGGSGANAAAGAMAYTSAPSWTLSPPEESATAAAMRVGDGSGSSGVGSANELAWGQGAVPPPSPTWDLASLLQVISLSQQLGCAMASSSSPSAGTNLDASVSGSFSQSVQSAPPDEDAEADRTGFDLDGGVGTENADGTYVLPHADGMGEDVSAVPEPLDLTTSMSIANALHRDSHQNAQSYDS